eukprot:GILK01008824.1.p1 GENE.GILK01008824.1~~GILK01008824.1.p1  ORF type:complete len:460 (+),score=74.35 GILK01008824.1:110-1381(+)
MHTDHLKGLSPSWKRGTIFCSPVTKRLLLLKFGIDESRVTALDVNHTHIVNSHSSKHTDLISVSVIDANHCPGAVMFLFQGPFGCILHTGDFRYTPMQLDHPLLSAVAVNHLFMDATFADPTFNFPPRSAALREIVDIAKDNLDKRIMVGIDHLGKEEILITLAQELQTLVVVSDKRYEWITEMEAPNVFTTNKSEGFVHVVSRRDITRQAVQRWNAEEPTIAIVPTGWSALGAKRRPGQQIFYVPYSLHSSFPELLDFVSRLRPGRITFLCAPTQSNNGITLLRQHENPELNLLLKPIPQTALESSIQVTGDSTSGIQIGSKRPLQRTSSTVSKVRFSLDLHLRRRVNGKGAKIHRPASSENMNTTWRQDVAEDDPVFISILEQAASTLAEPVDQVKDESAAGDSQFDELIQLLDSDGETGA